MEKYISATIVEKKKFGKEKNNFFEENPMIQIIPKCKQCGKLMERGLAEINGVCQSYYYCPKNKKHPILIIDIWMDSRMKKGTANCDPPIIGMFAKVERKKKKTITFR